VSGGRRARRIACCRAPAFAGGQVGSHTPAAGAARPAACLVLRTGRSGIPGRARDDGTKRTRCHDAGTDRHPAPNGGERGRQPPGYPGRCPPGRDRGGCERRCPCPGDGRGPASGGRQAPHIACCRAGPRREREGACAFAVAASCSGGGGASPAARERRTADQGAAGRRRWGRAPDPGRDRFAAGAAAVRGVPAPPATHPGDGARERRRPLAS
jgi:hypothetical protein